MEPEGSLPHSPLPSTCPYREPHQSNSVYAFPSQFLKIHFMNILSSYAYIMSSTPLTKKKEHTGIKTASKIK